MPGELATGLASALAPNLYNCKCFRPNAFRQGRCMDCGLSWSQHQGVIAEEYISKYCSLGELRAVVVAAEEGAATEKCAESVTPVLPAEPLPELEAEEERAAESWRPSMSGRGGTRTAEQDWFYTDADMRCDRGEGDSAEVAAGGFEMSEITPQEKSQVVQQLSSPKVKVVNLINFEECNVSDDPDTRSRMSIANHDDVLGKWEDLEATSSCSGETIAESLELSQTSSEADPSSSDGGHAGRAKQEELLAEIQHLKERLLDTHVEKQIELDIVRNQLAAKQLLVEELLKQSSELEQKCGALEQRCAELEQRNGLLQQQSAELSELDRRRLQKLEAQLSYARQYYKDSAAKQQRVEYLEAQLMSMRKQYTSVRAQLANEQLRNEGVVPRKSPLYRQVDFSWGSIGFSILDALADIWEARGSTTTGPPPRKGCLKRPLAPLPLPAPAQPHAPRSPRQRAPAPRPNLRRKLANG